ncbi:hypothetical protein [Mesorhizobium sp.]|nr:hypothetical protein [Mesorhizobium sp.]
MPELAFEEHRSVAEQIALLEQEGFRIGKKVGGMPTAFLGGTWKRRVYPRFFWGSWMRCRDSRKFRA